MCPQLECQVLQSKLFLVLEKIHETEHVAGGSLRFEPCVLFHTKQKF